MNIGGAGRPFENFKQRMRAVGAISRSRHGFAAICKAERTNARMSMRPAFAARRALNTADWRFSMLFSNKKRRIEHSGVLILKSGLALINAFCGAKWPQPEPLRRKSLPIPQVRERRLTASTCHLGHCISNTIRPRRLPRFLKAFRRPVRYGF